MFGGVDPRQQPGSTPPSIGLLLPMWLLEEIVSCRTFSRTLFFTFRCELSDVAGLRYTNQVAHQIVEIFAAELGTVISGHQRMGLIFDAVQFKFVKKVERAIWRLQLQGEVIFVTRNARLFLSVRCGYNNGSVPKGKVFVWISNCASSFDRRLCAGIVRKIGAKEASFTVYHVALRTRSFSKEEMLPVFWIAGQLGCQIVPLQMPNMSNNGLNSNVTERVKRRHTSALNPVSHNTEKSCVGQPLNLSAIGDVGAALRSSAVEAVAASASAREDSRPFR